MANIVHVGRLSNEEKIKILHAFLNSPYKLFTPAIQYLNWHSTMNSHNDMVSADGGKLVYVANDGKYTYLAEKTTTGYNVSMVVWPTT